jgi:hypothetical protein
VRKVVFTLNINNYAPEIRALTYPLLKFYAKRIGAEFREITERKYPEWPVVYEKLQIYELGRGYDWIYFFDADTLVHPETIDFSWFLPPDVCCHNAQDHAAIRFRYDEAFAKDTANNIGTCGWFTLAPAACIDIWRPTDQTPQEVIDACFPTMAELRSGLIDKGHLADDYVMSRNIAQFQIRHATVKNLLPEIGLPGADFFWHIYMVTEKEKVRQMKQTLKRWNLPSRLLDGC